MTRADLASLAEQARREVEALERELAEIEMLVQQATTEAARHEAKRAQLTGKLAALAANRSTEPAELGALADQAITLTKRAALMEAQVEVLAGKQKTLGRYRDALVGYADQIDALASLAAESGPPAGASGPVADGGPSDGSEGTSPPLVSRLVLGAQEDLRRDIARAMHDGPAQSLTNIVLQAEIVERLLTQDPERARSELRHLTAMVQSTLEATKSFIFDVRPMVLDDLGLVPTIRRAARDRGRRARIAVDFDSVGADRRLPMELESALFRMLDEALAAYLGQRPERVVIRLDWSDRLEASVAALRAEAPAGAVAVPGGAATATTSAPPRTAASKGRGRGRGAEPAEELPPALAAMIEERRAESEAATTAARSSIGLPATTWREIEERAATLGVSAELLAGGSELRLVVALSAPG